MITLKKVSGAATAHDLCKQVNSGLISKIYSFPSLNPKKKNRTQVLDIADLYCYAFYL